MVRPAAVHARLSHVVRVLDGRSAAEGPTGRRPLYVRGWLALVRRFSIRANAEGHGPSKCGAGSHDSHSRSNHIPLSAPRPAIIAHNVNLKTIFGKIHIIFGIMCALHRQSFNSIRHNVGIARPAAKI